MRELRYVCKDNEGLPGSELASAELTVLGKFNH